MNEAINTINWPEMLTLNFTVSDLTKTNQKASNTPHSPVVYANLRQVALNILEPAYAYFKIRPKINSGYRSPAVNKLVGGSATSQHCKGEAVDFEIPGVRNYDLACWVRDTLNFDQLILEDYVPSLPNSGWVHCSYKSDLRFKANTKFKGSSIYHNDIILCVERKN
ncbi:MAG: D-Ala-D-Ala carboxypeptidase family metallohydrolase [Limnobacter sp.]|nr:D-Ala-D-Ala carboxypeptidase family metallohydrolase [Limnobacter sp.]